jgi:3-oxoacyl-[acyl-carrier-protein] synthase II
MDSARDVVVTGMGCVSPHGRGVRAFWDGLIAGRSALKPITQFDASVFRNAQAGVVDGYDPVGDTRTPARSIRMLLDAAREALRDACGIAGECDDAQLRARLSSQGEMAKAALVAGTNFGGMSAAETALVEGRTDPSKAGLGGYLFGAATDALATTFGIGGTHTNISLSCASGTAAIGLALDHIRLGRTNVAIAAGYDELSLYIYSGLSALRAITTETIRPFDMRRKGTQFSEGAGVLVLESAEHAAKRGARRIHARVLGRFMNNDAYHMTAPEQEARGIKALIRAALKDAGVGAEQIDHLNLHATGTPFNDAIETKAVLDVFGERGEQIPVCSVKSSIGHTMGAAGVIESIAAIRTLQEGLVPPVLGLELEHKDPACNLNAAVGAPLEAAVRTVLKTSYGFGGTNAAVVLASA